MSTELVGYKSDHPKDSKKLLPDAPVFTNALPLIPWLSVPYSCGQGWIQGEPPWILLAMKVQLTSIGGPVTL